MDKTDEYKIRCEAAREVQFCVNSENPKVKTLIDEGSFFWISVHSGIRTKAAILCSLPPSAVWMPRLDQLYYMLPIHRHYHLVKCSPYNYEAYSIQEYSTYAGKVETEHGLFRQASPELVMLDIVMCTRYRKLWNTKTKNWETVKRRNE
jgi:hypothetical protein